MRLVTKALWGSFLVLLLTFCINIRMIQNASIGITGNKSSILEQFWEASKGRHLAFQSTTDDEQPMNITSSKHAPIPTNTPPEPTVQPQPASAVQDGFCGGCRSTLAKNDGSMRTCGYLLRTAARERNLSLSLITTDVVREWVERRHYEACRRCLPEACSNAHKVYWRLDHAAPTILDATSHYLSSIPESYRVPVQEILGPALVVPTSHQHFNHQAETKLEQFFSNPLNSHPQRQYLFEYNPSILQLPKRQRPVINGEKPVYLASYRVSNDQVCFSTNVTRTLLGGDWDQRPPPQSYLGLAVLRSDLSIIHDVVLDLSEEQFGMGEDFRLFVLRGQMYVGTFGSLVPLWIQKPNQMSGRYICNHLFNHTSSSTLQVVLAKRHIRISSDPKTRFKAKNINYFVGADSPSDKHILAEIFPTGPRIVHQLHVRQHVDPDIVFQDDYLPERSFYTRDELDLANDFNLFESPFARDRGSTCCVTINHPTQSNKTLFLGISHTKTPYKRKRSSTKGVAANQYVSRFYAFEQAAPYRLVALSGYFCLAQNPPISKVSTLRQEGSPNIATANTTNPYAILPMDGNLLKIGKTTYNCPAIHFVSGMVENAEDPSRLIIAYGSSDCTSQFIQVSKAEVVNMLFSSAPKKFHEPSFPVS